MHPEIFLQLHHDQTGNQVGFAHVEGVIVVSDTQHGGSTATQNKSSSANTNNSRWNNEKMNFDEVFKTSVSP